MSDLTWRDVWRWGFAPQLPLAGLEALAVALRTDSPELIEDAGALPLASGLPCEGACAGAFPLWKGLGLTTADEVEIGFGAVCEEANARLWWRTSSRRVPSSLFTEGFWDNRKIDRRTRCELLLPLVEEEIARRKESTHAVFASS